MNEPTKKACFEEISHLICDCDKKVNIGDISNNWNLSFRDSENILLEWLQQHQDRVLTKEYLIRGVDKQEQCVISVVQESRVAALEKRFAKFCSSLYSLELPSSNIQQLSNVELSKTNHIKLPLEGETRACKVLPIIIAEVKTDSKPIKAESADTKKNSVSAMFASKTATKSETKPKPQEPEDTAKTEAIVKSEAQTPKKESPKKKGPPKLLTVQTGRSAISSFFSAKPTATSVSKSIESIPLSAANGHVNGKAQSDNVEAKHSTEKKVAHEVKKDLSSKEKSDRKAIEKTPAKNVKPENEDKTSGKRSFAAVEDSEDEVIAGTPQDTKKIRKKPALKKKPTPNTKHSRIRQIVDSSEDEAMDDIRPDIPEPSPVKKNVKEAPKVNMNTKKRAKRTVTKTYKDEDGYLITAKEIEEYSCSDEDDVVAADTSKGEKCNSLTKGAVATSLSTTNTEKTPKKGKKITPPKATAGTKQGSILSFFGKK